MKCVSVSTTHQTGNGIFLRHNAHDTKKYELEDKKKQNIEHVILLFDFFFFKFNNVFF